MRWVHGLLLVTLTLALAAYAGWHSALFYLRNQVLAEVPVPFGSDPELQVNRADAILASNPERLPEMAGGLSAMDRAALARNPLNVVAMRQLGMIAGLAPTAGAGARQFAAAETITRRDYLNQLALIDLAAAGGATGDALVHYDRALRVYRFSAERLFPILARGINDPDIRKALVIHAESPWFAPFIRSALGGGAEPGSLVALLGASRVRLKPGEADNWAAGLVAALAGRGRYLDARAVASSLPGASGPLVRQIDVTPQTAREGLSPLTWMLADRTGAQATVLDPAGLAITQGGERQEVLAERVTLLEAGVYEVSQAVRISATPGGLQLTWTITCLGGAGEPVLWEGKARPEREGFIRGRFEVPFSCPGQRWRLVGTSGTSQLDSTARLTDLMVVGV